MFPPRTLCLWEALDNDRLLFLEMKIAMLHIVQIVIGVLGNFSLIFLHSRGCRLRSTKLIVRHLSVANSLVILSVGAPQTMVALGWKEFLNDVGCKLVFYVHRVARGVSIGSTCLLSVFQAITIGLRSSRWAKLKLKALNYIGPTNTLSWVLHMLVNAVFPIYTSGKRSNKTIPMTNHLGYCSVPLNDNITFTLFTALITSHDVLCLGLMSWASSSMILILYRHKQRVKHIYKNNLSHRSSPESRATQSILVLVSTFVSFYSLSSIVYSYLAFLNNYSVWLSNISTLLTSCFPTLSPFILMNSDPHVLRLCCVCCGRNTQFPSLVRKT